MSTAKKAPKQQRPIQREITIDGWDRGCEEIVDILSQNHAVEELIIADCQGEITTPVISAIFELKNLTSLDLYDNQLGDTGATEIAKHLVGSNLTNLNLARNQIGHRGAAAIANHLVGSNLNTLDLSENRIGHAGATEIIKNIVGSNVNTLYLGDNLIGDYVPEEDDDYVPQQIIDKWNELGKDPQSLIL